MTTHDKSYKAIFTYPEIIQQLLQSFIQQDWVQELDFSTLEKTNSSFVSDDLRERFDDIIWKVRWQNQDLYIYLLLEFQSGRDYFMAVRLMTYIGLLYQDLINSQNLKAGDKLPPVLPIVLYRGLAEWDCPQTIQELIAAPSKTLTQYQPQLSYCLIDECRYSHETLQHIDNALAMLFQLEKEDEIFAKAKQVARLFFLVKHQPELERTFKHWVEYNLSTRLENPQVFQKATNLEEIAIMLEECIDSWVTQWKKQGLQEGELKGRLEGRLEGQIEGEALLLLRLLRKRFGTLPEWVESKLQHASGAELEQWAEAILDVHTLEAVFNDS